LSINFRQEGDYIIVLGQTYAFKDAIKSIGCTFDGSRKIWQIRFSDSALAAIESLCQSNGGGRLETLPADTQDIPEAVSRRMGSIPPRELRLAAMPPVLSILPEPADLGSSAPTIGGISISELMDRAQTVISHAFPLPVWIIGEIQNLQNKGGRGIYLNLAEGIDGASDAATISVNATIWANTLRLIEHRHGKAALQDVLADGLSVRCLCQVSFYKGRGNLSLSIQDIDVAFTKGALALQRERLLRELKVKGLDQKNKVLPFPAFPFRVGLVCAEGSRAQTDFTHQLFDTGFCGEIVFIAAAAQGERVISEVPAAIRTLESARCDIIVLTRGGGSAADLRWFDAAEVAYAICGCSIPIVAAIGHHDDESVAEIVSHLRCKTPTAAADVIAERFLRTRKRIEEVAEIFANGLSRQVEFYQEKQVRITERLNASAVHALGQRDQHLLRMTAQLTTTWQNVFSSLQKLFAKLAGELAHLAFRNTTNSERILAELDKVLAGMDPRPWLNQGWTQLFSGPAQIKSLADLELNCMLRARLSDGTVDLMVTGINPAKRVKDDK
jgi:exodeoxyribonuclease VII large subunit